MSADPALALSGRRILIVEDEMLVGMAIEDALTDAGCEIEGPVGQVKKALALLAMDCRFDAAIMDVNLGGDSSEPIAEALSDRAIPFLILTGYGPASLPKAYREAPVLSKPADPAELAAKVSRLIADAQR